jgi:hypothetical protein
MPIGERFVFVRFLRISILNTSYSILIYSVSYCSGILFWLESCLVSVPILQGFQNLVGMRVLILQGFPNLVGIVCDGLCGRFIVILQDLANLVGMGYI